MTGKGTVLSLCKLCALHIHGRSLQVELKMILEREARKSSDDFWKTAARLRERTAGISHTDSTDLVRESRDER